MHDNYNSDLKRVNFSVPQGGAVSPVLFLMFINVIGKCININKYALYGDYTSLFLKSNTISNLYAQGNLVIYSSYNWFITNGLTVNIYKTFHMIFRRKQSNVACSF